MVMIRCRQKKTYALELQGAPDPEQIAKSLRYLAGMTGTGLGMKLSGKIVHTNSEASLGG